MDILLGYTECKLDQVSVHQVGNKTNEEELVLSAGKLDIGDDQLTDLLMTFFLKPFEGIEFYHFTFSNEDIDLNPVYNFACKIFEVADNFHSVS